MNCPHCNAESRVLETRQGSFYTLARRRECEFCLKRFTTVEIHQPVFCTAKPRAKAYAKTVEQRAALVARDIELARRSHEGWQKLAKEFNLERSSVFYGARRGRKYIKEQRATA